MIKTINLCKTYNAKKANECKALADVSIEIQDGEFISIVGKSGSGKSTLLHILGCVDKASSGECYINDKSTSKFSDKQLAKLRCNEIGIVKQDFALIEDYTALQNITVPLYFSKSKNKIQLAKTALKAVDILEIADKQVSKLSGGQKQRVAIARAIVNNPAIILADEPTGSLDSSTANDIMQIFENLSKQGKTIIIITHDMQIAERADRIITLSDGRVVG